MEPHSEGVSEMTDYQLAFVLLEATRAFDLHAAAVDPFSVRVRRTLMSFLRAVDVAYAAVIGRPKVADLPRT